MEELRQTCRRNLYGDDDGRRGERRRRVKRKQQRVRSKLYGEKRFDATCDADVERFDENRVLADGLAADTTYYVRVKAEGTGIYEDSNWSSTQSAKTSQNTQKLATPTLSVSTKSKSELNVTVGYVANASGYTLEYATNASFTGKKTQTVSAGSFTLNGLNANTTYYVRVKAEGTGRYEDSNWSSTQSAKTLAETTKLATPSLTVRSNSYRLIVNVGAVANASAYALEYATNALFANAESVTMQTFFAGTDRILNGLSANTRYYFRVKAVGTGLYADSDWSATQVGVYSDPFDRFTTASSAVLETESERFESPFAANDPTFETYPLAPFEETDDWQSEWTQEFATQNVGTATLVKMSGETTKTEAKSAAQKAREIVFGNFFDDELEEFI